MIKFDGKTFPKLSFHREKDEVRLAIKAEGVLSVEKMAEVASLLQNQMQGKTIVYHHVFHGDTVRLGWVYPGCSVGNVHYLSKVPQLILHIIDERTLILTLKTQYRILEYEDALVYEFCINKDGEEYRHYLELPDPPQ